MTEARAPGRVILSQAPADFDPLRDVALGPWCFAGIERDHPGWEELSFPEPFPLADDWLNAARHTRALANQLVPDWAERLNRRHGCSYSLGFWRLFLLNWLIMAVQPLWYRYRALEALAAANPGPLTVERFEGDVHWDFPDLNALHDSFSRPDFDLWMTSLAADAVLPAAWPRSPRRVESRPRKAAAPPPASATLAGRLARTVFGRLAFGSIAGVRAAKIPLSLLIRLLPRRGQAKSHYHFDDAGVFARFPDGFLSLLDRFLEQVLPESFGDGFKVLETRALAQAYVPGRLFIDTVASPDDSLRLIAAMALERGEKLVTSQHGAAYGISAAMAAAAATEYPYHAFITWGWTRHGPYPGHFVPLPAPALTRFMDRHRPEGDTIVHVGGTLAVRGTRLGWLPRPAEFIAYRRDKLAFLAALSPELRQRLAYRPYLRNLQDLEDEDAVKTAFPDVAILTGDLHAAMFACRLLVLDHPGTTLSIALVADVPTICFWRDTHWPSCPEAEPQVEALRRAGILFDRPEDAAAQLDRIAADPQGWWHGREVRAARALWLSHHGRASRWWPLHWALALWRLATEKT